jgi:hypothetical protein|tara:strand:+ start:553 stop:825 length:273 start_codon:yes stop_codon:yes gene_type:complete
MIDLKKLSIYHKYEGVSDEPELYNERNEKWLNKEISLDEFIIISKLDELCFCVRSGEYSSKMVNKMNLEISELKENVSIEVFEYLSSGKK